MWPFREFFLLIPFVVSDTLKMSLMLVRVCNVDRKHITSFVLLKKSEIFDSESPPSIDCQKMIFFCALEHEFRRSVSIWARAVPPRVSRIWLHWTEGGE